MVWKLPLGKEVVVVVEDIEVEDKEGVVGAAGMLLADTVVVEDILVADKQVVQRMGNPELDTALVGAAMDN